MDRSTLKPPDQQTVVEREALFRRFGYDADASLKFILSKTLPLPGHVLEIGTGKGGFLARLAGRAEQITTLDIDPEQQQLAKCHVSRGGEHCPVKYVIHDAERLPWGDASFDNVVSVNTFHHLQHPRRVLEEMLRVLKPGGRLVLADLSPRGFQIFDRIHRLERRIHPRLKKGLSEFECLVRRRVEAIRRFKGCNQELLVARRRTSIE